MLYIIIIRLAPSSDRQCKSVNMCAKHGKLDWIA